MMFGKKQEKIPDTKSIPDPETMVSTVKKALDSQDFKYRYIDEAKVFVTSFMGDDLPIGLQIRVRDGLLHFMCILDLKAAPDNYSKVAWELNCINKQLLFGAFVLDPDDGMITFDYGFPYLEADVSPEFILRFSKLLIDTVDDHDGKLKEIAESAGRNIDAMYI